MSDTMNEEDGVGDSITGKNRGQVIWGVMVQARCLSECHSWEDFEQGSFMI